MKMSTPRLMSFGPTLLFLIVQLSSLIVPSNAQSSKLFQWQFANNAISDSLPTCASLPVIVKSFNADNSTNGTPPYYMMAFEVGGVPTTTLIGTDENNLSWTVDHAANTQLMLGVVDSNKSSGGIPPRLYNVVTGQSTTCLNTPPSPSTFTVTSNITGTVTTCQPWGLTIQGGVKPYTVTLAALNSPIVTNVTMGPEDDAFTYIDRADPNTQLLAAVSDFTNRFASGTPIVKTIGSTDVDCTGLVSSSGNATVIKQQAQAAAAAVRAHKRKMVIIIAVCVTLAGLLLIVATIFVVRRKREQQREWASQFVPDTAPRQFEEGDHAQVLTIPQRSGNPHSPKPFTGSTPSSSAMLTGASSFDPYQSESGSSQRISSGFPTTRPGFTTFPPPIHRSAKALEAGLVSPESMETSTRPDSSSSSADSRSPFSGGRPTSLQASSLRSDPSRWPTRSASLQANGGDTATVASADIIYQHRDGGGVVRELPPPYADRTANAAQPV